MSRESKLHGISPTVWQPPSELLRGTKELTPYDFAVKDVFMLPLRGEMRSEALAVFLDHFTQQTVDASSYALLIHLNEREQDPKDITQENDQVEAFVAAMKEKDIHKVQLAVQTLPQNLQIKYTRLADMIIKGGLRIDCVRSAARDTVHFGRLRNTLIQVASGLVEDPARVVGHFIDVDTPLRHNHVQVLREAYEDTDRPLAANIADHDLLPAISKEHEIEMKYPERFNEFNDAALRFFDLHRQVEYIRHVTGIAFDTCYATNTPTISARLSVLTSPEVVTILENSPVAEDYELAKYLFNMFGSQCGSSGLIYYGRREMRSIPTTHMGDGEDRAEVNLGILNGIEFDLVGDLFDAIGISAKTLPALPELQSFFSVLDSEAEFSVEIAALLKQKLIQDIPQFDLFFDLFTAIPEAQPMILNKLNQLYFALQVIKQFNPTLQDPGIFAKSTEALFDVIADTGTGPAFKLPAHSTVLIAVLKQVIVESCAIKDPSYTRQEIETILWERTQETEMHERKVIEKRIGVLRGMIAYHQRAQKTGEVFPTDEFRYAEPYYQRYSSLLDLSFYQCLRAWVSNITHPSETSVRAIIQRAEREFPDLLTYTQVHSEIAQLKALKQIVSDFGSPFSFPVQFPVEAI